MTNLADEKRVTDEEARDDELSEQELEAAAGGVLVEPTPIRRERSEVGELVKGDILPPTKRQLMTRTPYPGSK